MVPAVPTQRLLPPRMPTTSWRRCGGSGDSHKGGGEGAGQHERRRCVHVAEWIEDMEQLMQQWYFDLDGR